MDYEQFLDIVRHQSQRDIEDAERAVRAVLQTLAERLSRGRARDLSREVPAELMGLLHKEGAPEPFDVDEFLRRVAEREGVDLATAESDARAVFVALRRAVSAAEFEALAADLPADFQPILWNLQIVPLDQFLRAVADDADIDPDAARRAVDAVLETLAERIADGDIRDLRTWLPLPLHAPLERGRAQRDARSQRMTVEQFVTRVAERAGVTPDQAVREIRAVLRTLRWAVPEEYYDVTAQLPPSYSVLIPLPTADRRRTRRAA